MKELDWFVKTLENEFSVEVDCNQISYEGHELYLDEIDESLIPPEMMKGLPTSMIFETMLYEDFEGTEWLGVIVLHPISRKRLIKILLKNGEPVLRRLVEREN